MAVGDYLSVLSHGLIVTDSGGGSCDYPDEDDVRFGIVFGGGTGTLTLPAESDVRHGIEYGADGDEFTGTYGGTPSSGYAQPGEAIAARLLTALAGTHAAGRVFPTYPTQDAPPFPFVVYRRISGGGDNILGGRSKLQRYSYRVDIYAETEKGAEAILTAINNETTGLPGWRDRPNGVNLVLPEDDADGDVTADEIRVPGQSYSIWFVER